MSDLPHNLEDVIQGCIVDLEQADEHLDRATNEDSLQEFIEARRVINAVRERVHGILDALQPVLEPEVPR